ncbi:MAG: hypothetical protein ABS75_34020 [Pelagibacterium sp. SCN 63-23]|nr:MAG: hypothetical protein ABS75_34020 [Pelagibacterium sp. SCN 63-23]
MTQLTILLVESSGPKAGLLSSTIETVGFKVAHASNLQLVADALTASDPIHLVLGNWIQHGFSGLEMADLVHGRSKVLLPIVLYAPIVSSEETAAAKKAGISDVLSLPISEIELYQKLTRILRERYPWAYPSRSIVGDIELDRESHVVMRRGKRIHLTPNDFRLLELLLRKPGEVMSREVLLEAISSHDGAGIRTVDVRVQRLKAALTVGGAPPPIKAVRGKGYVMEE